MCLSELAALCNSMVPNLTLYMLQCCFLADSSCTWSTLTEYKNVEKEVVMAKGSTTRVAGRGEWEFNRHLDTRVVGSNPGAGHKSNVTLQS